jgi:hypothetical protein
MEGGGGRGETMEGEGEGGRRPPPRTNDDERDVMVKDRTNANKGGEHSRQRC